MPGRDGVLIRQKTVLSLLKRAGKPLPPMVFVKLIFLLRRETGLKKEPSFYDFVPYNYGPFSFMLYWDLGSLRQNGYVTPEKDRVALCEHTLELTEKEAAQLSKSIQDAVAEVLSRYGGWIRAPWFVASILATPGSRSTAS